MAYAWLGAPSPSTRRRPYAHCIVQLDLSPPKMTQQSTTTEKKIDLFCPTDQQQWRAWLQENHNKKQAVWLVYHKKKSGIPRLAHTNAVDEALCFGWIDSTARPVDDHTYRQFFCRRKPTGTWSNVNKEKVRRLIQDGLMTEAGLASIETAKQNGSWAILDEVEALLIPADLADAFQENPDAGQYFTGLCRSDKRALLLWLTLARRSETRQNRLTELVESANQQQKPKAIQWPRKRPL